MTDQPENTQLYAKAMVQLLEKISKQLEENELNRQRDNQKISKQNDVISGLQRALLIRPDNIFSFQHEDHEIKFYFPSASYETMQMKILQMASFYEGHLLSKIRPLLKGAAVLDVGANIGNHTIYFSKIGKAKSVRSFEPQHQVFKMLDRNILLNGLNNVVAENHAVGARTGSLAIEASKSKNLGTTSFTDGEGYPVKSIDEMGFPVDFIKIDVEGFHVPVLNGAADTLAEKSPKIWIELRAALGEFESGDAILRRHGYKHTNLDVNNYLYEKS